MSPARDRFEASRVAAETFFNANADRVSHLCRAMAERFDRGGRLLVLGAGTAASDARHVAVEFVHPVLVGKRALPAIAITTPISDDLDGWVARVSPLVRREDLVLALSHTSCEETLLRALAECRTRGTMTIAFVGANSAGDSSADYVFAAAGRDPLVVQEVQETLYHVLWELVHVFLRGSILCDTSESCALCGDEAVPGLVLAVDERARTAVVSIASDEREVALDLVDAHVGDTVLVHQGFAITAVGAGSGASDPGRELYPFLYDDNPSRPGDDALAEVRNSTIEKLGDVVALRAALLAEYEEQLADCASRMSERFRAGGKLISFGNGGSATDADDAAEDCAVPARPGWRALPSLALTGDVAVISAIANDVGFENVFTRQLIAFGSSGDMALGISTSGNSANVIAALGEARARGMMTIALSGNDGGQMDSADVADFCFVARTEHIPRIQEGQATVWHTLLELVQENLS